MTEPIGPAPLVTVRGEAQLEGPPDLATLALTLHASGDSAERTRAQLAEGSAAVARAPATVRGSSGAVEHQRRCMFHRSSTDAALPRSLATRAPSPPRSWSPISSSLSPLVLALTALTEQPDRRALVVAAA